MVDESPWEPPLAGTEAQHLLGALDRLRTTFRWKADGLDVEGLNTRLGASRLTIGGLLKHLARVEAERFGPLLDGAPIAPPWDEPDWDSQPDWDFESAARDTPTQWTSRQPTTQCLRPDRGIRAPHRTCRPHP